ncbi:unnamed protein product, partial [Rotaria magnacalcarata]
KHSIRIKFLSSFIIDISLAPTHTILAFKRALDELDQEGGVHGRAKRYEANNKLIREKMKTLG